MKQNFDEENGYKQCLLYDRGCIECGECDLCDLDPNKICDNCMACVPHSDADFLAIGIEKIEKPGE